MNFMATGITLSTQYPRQSCNTYFLTIPYVRIDNYQSLAIHYALLDGLARQIRIDFLQQLI